MMTLHQPYKYWAKNDFRRKHIHACVYKVGLKYDGCWYALLKHTDSTLKDQKISMCTIDKVSYGTAVEILVHSSSPDKIFNSSGWKQGLIQEEFNQN